MDLNLVWCMLNKATMFIAVSVLTYMKAYNSSLLTSVKLMCLQNRNTPHAATYSELVLMLVTDLTYTQSHTFLPFIFPTWRFRLDT